MISGWWLVALYAGAAVACVTGGIVVGYRMEKANQRWWAEFWRNR